MQTRELLELLAEAAHVSELTRLLSAFSRRETARLGKPELIELANQTAGATYRYPNPEPALEVALAVGLVRKDEQLISLTDTGRLFLKERATHGLELSIEQASLLLGLFLDDPRMAEQIGALLRQFREGSTTRLEAKTMPAVWQESTRTAAKILQQLGILEDRAGNLCLNTVFESVLPQSVLALAGLSEQALWERLEAQRLRAREAEKLVVMEEQKRLVKLGRGDLAELVVRVSADNVSAGYDIESFEEDASRRLIEVKSSVGKAIRFEWSVREREIASENSDRYWIYFVPLAHLIKRRNVPIWMLRDPIALIRKGRLAESATSYVAWASAKATKRRGVESLIDSPMMEWPP
jgi:uncharacterized protein DUF3883